jgi:hypothetical protein
MKCGSEIKEKYPESPIISEEQKTLRDAQRYKEDY